MDITLAQILDDFFRSSVRVAELTRAIEETQKELEDLKKELASLKERFGADE